MGPAFRLLRLCFVVLFGAMSLTHGPVMTYRGHDAQHSAHAAPAAQPAPTLPDCHDHPSFGTAPPDHSSGEPPAEHPTLPGCNAFACLMAVEPLPSRLRPLRSTMFAVLAAAPAAPLDPIPAIPALPPPRLPA